ncbi:MAG: hypothetical protein U0271_10095 [Polyangiaceae bacterium]
MQVLAETLLLAGDLRAAALFEVAPIPQFAFALGGGVGTMFSANFFFDSPSADFASGFIRLEGRLASSYDDMREDGQFVFGGECQFGYVFRGSLPEGAALIGPRAFVGILLR